MSRIANKPVAIPSGVKVEFKDNIVQVTASKARLECAVSPKVEIRQDGSYLKVFSKKVDRQSDAIAGTLRMMLFNMVKGVSEGFEKKLKLVGVGYRVAVTGNHLSLTLGFSHPVSYKAPQGIVFETPSQTDITIRGIDKQLVGQVAADVRRFRPPEPYKGKGVRYAEEIVHLKETKKK